MDTSGDVPVKIKQEPEDGKSIECHGLDRTPLCNFLTDIS